MTWERRWPPAGFARICCFVLNVVNLHLPALRERPPDIALRRQVRQSQRYASAPLSEAALAQLRAHAWAVQRP